MLVGGLSSVPPLAAPLTVLTFQLPSVLGVGDCDSSLLCQFTWENTTLLRRPVAKTHLL